MLSSIMKINQGQGTKVTRLDINWDGIGDGSKGKEAAKCAKVGSITQAETVAWTKDTLDCWLLLTYVHLNNQ